MSSLLSSEGRTPLDERWTITPVGGASKVPTFVALLGSQKGMTIATLIDSSVADRPKIEDLYKQKLLKKANVLTFADFTKAAESDVEDMFGDAFYIDLVSLEFAKHLPTPIVPTSFTSKSPRIVERLEAYFAVQPMNGAIFSHYRPARYMSENLALLKSKIPGEAKDKFELAFKALNSIL